MKQKTNFPDYFREIQVRFSRFYASILNRADISISQYALLNELVDSGCIPMSGVGAKLHISKPAVTHLVDRLEEKNFLRRISHPTDRRISLLKILPKGKKIVEKIQRNVYEIVSKGLGSFGRTEQEIIVRYQKSISNIIENVLSRIESE